MDAALRPRAPTTSRHVCVSFAALVSTDVLVQDSELLCFLSSAGAGGLVSRTWREEGHLRCDGVGPQQQRGAAGRDR